jgi:hypothetical protein
MNGGRKEGNAPGYICKYKRRREEKRQLEKRREVK